MRAVFYGHPRGPKGTTTFSGSLGFHDVRAFIGPDYGKKVYMAMAAVHGGEIEAYRRDGEPDRRARNRERPAR